MSSSRRPVPVASQVRSNGAWARGGLRAAHVLAVMLAMLAGQGPAQAAAEAKAAKPPVSISVFVSSRKDLCFDPGDVAAIKRLAALEQDRINRQGGISGRLVQLRFHDDEADQAKTLAGVRAAIGDPSTLAMIGITNSNRAKAVFDAAGREIKESGVPFLSDISVNSIFADAPNVYTTRASQDDERIPVMAQFMSQMGYERPAFVGLKDAVFSTSLANGLKAVLGTGGLAGDFRLALKDDKLDPAELAAAFGELKGKSPDLLFLNVGASRSGAALRQLVAAGVTPPLFVTGRIDAIAPEIVRAYPNDIYQLAWDSLPDLYSDRLRRMISRANPDAWVFEGRRIAEAPGWAKGECKPRDADIPADPLEAANLRAIGMGAQFADMIGLIATAARTAGAAADIRKLRSSVLDEIATTYLSGHGAYKGSFENWSFQKSSRAAARTPLIVMLPKGLGRQQLAPIQFVRIKGDKLRRIDTLYADIDLIRAHRVEDNDKTFFAEFYLALHDNKMGLDQIEFTNAFLDPKTNDRQLTVRVLHAGGKSDAYPDSMRIYQIAGRFTFEPQLSNYPFDTQRFSIDIQPKRGDAPFIVQPPPQSLRDKSVATDGWDPKDQYVAYDADFVPVIDAFTHEPSVVPFYKASFVWLMQRQTTDYYLRVVVPLGFILIVAYLSIFIPHSHFEAIITLQVTALLSAVALYLSLPKLDADTATLSDRIFIFNYMLVSLMIGLSILRASRFVLSRGWLRHGIAIVHMIGVPMMVAAMGLYVLKLSAADG